MPKGVWRRNTDERLHVERAGAGYADGSGGGACFNDARVQVAESCARVDEPEEV